MPSAHPNAILYASDQVICFFFKKNIYFEWNKNKNFYFLKMFLYLSALSIFITTMNKIKNRSILI